MICSKDNISCEQLWSEDGPKCIISVFPNAHPAGGSCSVLDVPLGALWRSGAFHSVRFFQ